MTPFFKIGENPSSMKQALMVGNKHIPLVVALQTLTNSGYLMARIICIASKASDKAFVPKICWVFVL